MNPSEEIQRLLFSTLSADTVLSSLINGVYDRVPEDEIAFAEPKQAYVSFGPTDITDDYAECIDGEIHAVQIDAWSRQVGFLGAKKIVDRIKRLLNRSELQLTDNAITNITVTLARTFRDPDGVTSHGVVTVELQIEVN